MYVERERERERECVCVCEGERERGRAGEAFQRCHELGKPALWVVVGGEGQCAPERISPRIFGHSLGMDTVCARNIDRHVCGGHIVDPTP